MRTVGIGRGEFLRNVLTLMTGTLVAQIAPIAVSPVLTRLYSPVDFGGYAIYSTIATIVTLAGTGRHELAINVPRSDLIAAHLVVIACLWTATATVITATVAVISLAFGAHWIFGALPISVAIGGGTLALNYWLNRHQRYREIARSRALQGIVFAASSVVLGLSAISEGIILGFVAGQAVGLGYLIIRSLPEWVGLWGRITSSLLRRTARRYRDFPRVLIFAHSLNQLSFRLPILVMPLPFGAAAAGMYALTQQVVGLPMQLLGSSIGEVFRERASVALRQTGSCRALYLRTLLALSAIYAIPFAILITVSPLLFSMVFGAEWRPAGVIAQILSPMFYLQFVVSPLTSMFIIAEKQREDLTWQIGLISATVLSLSLGAWWGSLELCVALFSASYCVMYLIALIMTYCFTGARKT